MTGFMNEMSVLVGIFLYSSFVSCVFVPYTSLVQGCGAYYGVVGVLCLDLSRDSSTLPVMDK